MQMKKMDEVTTLTFPLSEIVAISRLGAEQQHIAVFALRGILATIWRVNKYTHQQGIGFQTNQEATTFFQTRDNGDNNKSNEDQ